VICVLCLFFGFDEIFFFFFLTLGIYAKNGGRNVFPAVSVGVWLLVFVNFG
jgi:hypothetical protein